MPFCFNAPYKFTPLHNLYFLIFSLTFFGWVISISHSFFFMGMFLIYTFLFMLTFSGTHLGHKTWSWCITGFNSDVKLF